MDVHIKKVLPRLVKFIRKEMFPAMVEWQEFIANIAISGITEDVDKLASQLTGNIAFKTILCIDDEGNVDLDRLIKRVETEMSQRGKLKISIPLMPKYTFAASDVENLKRILQEEE